MPVLRDAFLKLSTNSVAHRAIVGFPLSRKLTRRFVAGETMEEAVALVRQLNAANVLTTLDHLGESVTSPDEARRAKDDYLRALDAIAANGLLSHVSVKLTHMGLDLDPELCLDNMRQILGRARDLHNLVRIDMEDSTRTQLTLNLFKTLREEFDNVGIVIQACLYRSEADMRELYAMGARVRLCKGAYKEPPDIAFPAKKDTDANYLKLAELYLPPNGASSTAAASPALMVSPSSLGADSAFGSSLMPPYAGGLIPSSLIPHLALATHDERIINWAKEYIRAKQIPYDHFEFQMLYGIRSDLQRQLAAQGYPVRVYIPYGSHWYPYFMRRLAERPANVIFLVSNLFK